MKKCSVSIFIILILVSLLSVFSACVAQPKIVGQWTCSGSLQLTALDVKSNGTFTLESSSGDHTGTWAVDDQGNYVLTVTASSSFNVPTTLNVIFDDDNTLSVELTGGGSIGTFIRK